MTRSARFPTALAALAAAACARAPAPRKPPAPQPRPAASTAPNPCFNAQYRFACAVPPGFVITDEAEGPGVVMTLARRAVSSQSEATMTLRVEPTKTRTASAALDYRLRRNYGAGSEAVVLERAEAAHGDARGVEALLERRYASGVFRTRVFGFLKDGNVVVVDLTAPADAFDGRSDAVGEFASSMRFR